MSKYEQQLKILERDLEEELMDELHDRCVSYESKRGRPEVIVDVDLTNRAYILAGAYGIVTSILEEGGDD